MHFVLVGKNGFKSYFSPILLSERNMGIDYIYNFTVHKNPLYSICFLFFLIAGCFNSANKFIILKVNSIARKWKRDLCK